MAIATSDKLGNKVVTSDAWVAARKELLAKEKEFTRLRDELSRKRHEMPWEELRNNMCSKDRTGRRVWRTCSMDAAS